MISTWGPVVPDPTNPLAWAALTLAFVALIAVVLWCLLR